MQKVQLNFCKAGLSLQKVRKQRTKWGPFAEVLSVCKLFFKPHLQGEGVGRGGSDSVLLGRGRERRLSGPETLGTVGGPLDHGPSEEIQ